MRIAFRGGHFPAGSLVRAAIVAHDPATVAARLTAAVSRLTLRSRRGECRLARTLNDSRRTRLAAVGRLDRAILSFRCTRSVEKSLVLLWVFAGSRRNVQGAIVIRSAIFCSLAAVAK